MSGVRYPTVGRQLEAERQVRSAGGWPLDGVDDDWEEQLHQRVSAGDAGAYELLRDRLQSIAFDELGWGR